MPVRRRALALDPFTLYLILELCSSLFFSLVFTVNLLYHVTVVQLTPLQLVLIGTILETTVFLFEIPTGVLADVRSRRLSVIIGYALIGLGFVLEGSLPFFATVALAQDGVLATPSPAAPPKHGLSMRPVSSGLARRSCAGRRPGRQAG